MKKGTKFAKRSKKKSSGGFKKRKTLSGSTRVRNFIFVLNNPTAEDRDRMTNWDDAENRQIGQISNARYGIGQLEMGKDGTPHVQGYFVLKQQRRLQQIKEMIGGPTGWKRPHIEMRGGSHEQAKDYCKKEDSRVLPSSGGWRFEFGDEPNQGRRGTRRNTVMDNLAEDLNEGATLTELETNYPGSFLQHENKIVDKFIRNQGPRNLTPGKNNVLIYYGASGMGKSTSAKLDYPDHYRGQWPQGGRWWWPDYRGQKTIVFDEFRGNISYQQMLSLMDIHGMGIEYKGGNTENISKRVIITTVRDPSEWYAGVEDKSELQRRIRENATIYEFTGPVNWNAATTEEKFPRTEIGTDDFEFDPYVEQDFST